MNQTIKLDTRKRDGTYGEARIAPLRRGERNNALLTVKVCANGQPYDLAGKTVSLVATTAAEKLVGPCPMEVAEAGIARIMLPAALYSAVGSFRGYVEIRDGDTLVDTTDRFGGKVIECADLDSEQAAEFTPLLGELQNAVDEEAKRVEAEKARSQAETERVKVENERVKAEEKRAQDSKTRLEELAQAKTNAETATGEANTARDEAKKAATDATSAAGNATNAAGLAETAKTNANTAAEEANAAATKAEAAARKADGAAETAGAAASTAERAANKADTAAGNAESMAEKADASANNADIAAGKANEATVAATNAATKANEVEAKLTGNILKGKVKDTFVHVDDAFPSSLLGIEVEGAYRQDGTPSPDNPVPIEVVENPVVQVRGRNLLDTELLNDDNNFDTNQSSAGFWVYEFVTPSTGDYTVSVKRVVRNSCYLMVSDNPKYGAGNQAWFSHESAVSGATSASFKNVNAVYLYFSNSISYVQDVLEKVGGIQIEKGQTATALEPYTSQTLTFTLPAEHTYLAKLPDGTADEIMIDADGNVELVARVSKIEVKNLITLFGPGNASEDPYVIAAYKHSASTANSIICNAYKSVMWGKVHGEIYPRKVSNDIVIRNSEFTSKEQAAGLLDGVIVYIAVESVTYPLGKVTVPSLPDSISNVWTDAEVTPNTSIEYTRDVNIVVANLESAIASIAQG